MSRRPAAGLGPGRSGLTDRVGGEDGQASMLVIGLAVVVALMVAMVTDASAAYLRRQELDSLADGAALAAADGVRGEQVYRAGLADRAGIDPVLAQSYAATYLDSVGAARAFPGLRFTVSATPELVVVRVSAPLDLPFNPPGWERRPILTGIAAAYGAVSD